MLSVQLFVLPATVIETNERNKSAQADNEITEEWLSRNRTYAKMKELITEEEDVVVAITLKFVVHSSPDYFTHFPLTNSKGYKIHYRMFLEGADMRGTHKPKYVMTTRPSPPSEPHDLVYTDRYMCLYRIYY